MRVYFGQVGPSFKLGFYSFRIFSGDVANVAGDVNGDGYPDLIAWSRSGIRVELGDGKSFGAPQQWYSYPFPSSPIPVQRQTNLVADVTMDGKVDLLAWSGDVVYGSPVSYLPSDGSFFGFPEDMGKTTGNAFYGSVANGAANGVLIAWNPDSVWCESADDRCVDRRYASGLSGSWDPTQVGGGLSQFVGSVANFIVPFAGDPLPDLIAVDPDFVSVRRSVCDATTGCGYGSPVAWAESTFYGTVATLFGTTAR